ncbi:MAG: DUF4351 domain-containing protein, partial [Cyanobacteria bacterium P01_D01_bin.1]
YLGTSFLTYLNGCLHTLASYLCLVGLLNHTNQNPYTQTFSRLKLVPIRLWEQPPELFLNVPGLLPFAVLSDTDDRETTLRQVATRLQKIPSEVGRNNLISSTFILSGLVLNQELIEQILMSDLLEESVTYQSIKKKGLEQGIQMGIQQGMQQGIYKGIRQGQQQTLQKMALRLLTRKIGELPEEVTLSVKDLSFDQLESLSDALLDFTDLADLTTWLKVQTRESEAE